jgi:hypothetical protein
MTHAIPLLSLSLTYRKSYEVRRTICSRAPHDGHVPGLSECECTDPCTQQSHVLTKSLLRVNYQHPYLPWTTRMPNICKEAMTRFEHCLHSLAHTLH